MQVFKHGGVVHEVQAVVDVESLFLGKDQRILYEFLIGDCSRKIVVRVASLYSLNNYKEHVVLRITHNVRRQRVK